MDDFYSFMLQLASDHWFLFWCALWLWWGFFVIVVVIVSGFSKLLNRLLRTINIFTHGWPPEHLDANGDFKNDDPHPIIDEIKSTIDEEI